MATDGSLRDPEADSFASNEHCARLAGALLRLEAGLVDPKVLQAARGELAAGASQDEVLGLVMNGFKSAFLPLRERVQLVEQVLSEFAALGAEFSGEISRRRRAHV